MEKQINKEIMFKRFFNIYISNDFTRESVYYDDELKKSFSYKEIIEYLEYYFNHNIILDDEMCLYHKKRKELDFSHVNIIRYKQAYYNFVDGDYTFINDAIVYMGRYSNEIELEEYRKSLKNCYEKFYMDIQRFENSNYPTNFDNSINVKNFIRILIGEYARYVLKETYKTYKKKKSLNKAKCYVFLSKIMKADDLETIAKKIQEQNFLNYLDLVKIYDFVTTYKEAYKLSLEEAEKLETTLLKKVQKIKKYIKEENKIAKKEKINLETKVYEEERIDYCENLIIQYIDDKFSSIKKFCKRKHIPQELFKKDILIVKKYNPKLYEKFINIVKVQHEQKKANALEFLNNLIDKLKNGILLEDGSKREFDIIDYHSITNLKFNNLLSLTKKLINEEDAKIIRKFIRKYYYGKRIRKNSILEEKNIILLNGDKYEVTVEDKNYILSYLEKNEIPLLLSTYSAALKRYFSDGLPELENKKIYKIKKH